MNQTHSIDRTGRTGKVLLCAIVVGVLALGFYIISARLTETRNASMIGAVMFFVVVGAVLWRLTGGNHRDLRMPLGVAFVVTVLALPAAIQALTMSSDKKVDEKLPTVSQTMMGSNTKSDDSKMVKGSAPDSKAKSANTLVSSGDFQKQAHQGAGTASLIELVDGGHVLTLEKFSTDSGPDLRVELVDGKGSAKTVDLGALKGISGNQVYKIPAKVDVGAYNEVRIWCRAFSVTFTDARLA